MFFKVNDFVFGIFNKLAGGMTVPESKTYRKNNIIYFIRDIIIHIIIIFFNIQEELVRPHIVEIHFVTVVQYPSVR